MAKLIFITHPAVDVEPEVPSSKWKISSVGMEETQRLLELDFWTDADIILTSPETKALEVAKNASERFNIDLETINELKEINRDATGFLDEEKYMQAVEEFYLHPTDSYKGWESANDATLRVKSALENALRSNDYETIVVVGHGLIGTCLACWIKRIDPSFNEDPKISGCYMVIDWDNKKILSDWEKY